MQGTVIVTVLDSQGKVLKHVFIFLKHTFGAGSPKNPWIYPLTQDSSGKY